ncbi:DNA-processing protein DprA [Caldimonas sp. KR1-144]|uniref:DNA-processing protein DprA n=1 Tax=Caldimonas sp. KR1-144 TaxID=3400911 RepID=UPI003BFD8F45
MDRDELGAWLRLLLTPELGPGAQRQLLASFGGPQAVFDAPSSAWAQALGPAAAKRLSEPPEGLSALADATWQWLQAPSEAARTIITLGDPLYPASLLQTADPPLLLHALGRTELLSAASIGVVGSRNPTPQGAENARAFSQALSRAGLTVVSGMALGIDGAAHAGALDGPGSTVAVLGTGIDRVYPKRHLELAHRIAREGLLISECPLGAPPLAHHFPQRNRLIAGLSLGTLVVEAALQSGSLITARLASEMGREVFAIPGSIHSPQSRGCHALIRQGAKLVESAADVLEELHLPRPAAPDPEPPPASEDPLLAALGFDAVTLDELSTRTGIAPQELSARLLEFELAGDVARLPGQRIQRVSRA